MIASDGLVRLRVNPEKARVRVGIGPHGWTVKITETNGTRGVMAHARTAKQALVRALRLAETFRVSGIDLSMGWAYRHPQFSDESENNG